MGMTGPLFEYGLFSDETSLIVAVAIGFFFGLFLERGGLGDPRKLTGVFYLTDFTVPKVMFTAILVASSGLYLLSDLRLLDLDRVWFVPTYFWPQIAGGALFGVGFVISGYCPGTAVAALSTGRLDALFAMFGMFFGALVFAEMFPFLEDFYRSSRMEGATIMKLTGLNHWGVLLLLAGVALLMFYFMERYEKKMR
jgi:hypothetical protein